MSDPQHNGAAAAELEIFVARLVRLEDEKKEIADQIKEARTEAKSRGFDAKALTRIVKEKRETATERAARIETETIADLYRASLGMLGGTPLGEAARQRMEKPPATDQPEQKAPEEDSNRDGGEQPPADEKEQTISAEDIAAARERGRNDHRAGKRIIDNPFVAGDPRRAAWDEGWCAESGSDGMDIPAAWRRAKPSKPAKGGEV